MKELKIQVLVDNHDSWMVPFAKKLVLLLHEKGHKAKFLADPADVSTGDILCLLSCEKLFTKLHLNKNNVVVHGSDLPAGKGWSPLTWQILEGKDKITHTLFEATEEVDSGVVYMKRDLIFEGHELLPEMKEKQGELVNSMILEFVDNYSNNTGYSQKGEESIYRRRKPEDSELDVFTSIEEQFDLLRVCDNERYPAFFYYRDHKYYLRISKN